MGLHEIKIFCTTKEMISNLRDHPQSGREYLLAIHQTKNIQGAQNTKLPQNQRTNKEMSN
jgi:hypothetical protein